MTVRETDVVGWYREDAVVGVMFTEIALDDQNALPSPLMTRVGKTLKQHLIPKEFQELSMSFHLFAKCTGQQLDLPPIPIPRSTAESPPPPTRLRFLVLQLARRNSTAPFSAPACEPLA